VWVFDVFCLHLEANLSDGCVKGNHLVCLFHAWEFNRTSECVSIPYSDSGHQNSKTNAKSWIIKENWGLILVWHHSDNELPSWNTEGYFKELKDYKYYGNTKDEIRIPLQYFSENGADYAHY
jgi:3-ketosteroid 9alpha-monooxygenase subunit A